MSDILHEKTNVRCNRNDCENGVIVKKTLTELAIPKSEVRIGGGPPPMKKTITCFCNSCGTMYEPDVILV